MVTVALIVLVSAGVVGWLRMWLARRELEIDYEREYRVPPIIGVMPNVPPG